MNVAANHSDYGHWGYVNYDGHPNFLVNYLAAIAIFDAMEHTNATADFQRTGWYESLTSEIDFTREDFHKYLFGINWDKARDVYHDRSGRWLRGNAKVILRGSELPKGERILVEGLSPVQGNSITAVRRGGGICSRSTIEDKGLFKVTLDLGPGKPASLLLIDLAPSSPVFLLRIKALDSH